MKFTFTYNEKLKSQKLIEKLFSEGKSVTLFPLKVIYLYDGGYNQVGVSVSKKNFRRAVDRNRIKRLLREVFRLNKKMLTDNNISGYAFMILYIGKDIPDFNLLNRKVQLLFTKYLDGLSNS